MKNYLINFNYTTNFKPFYKKNINKFNCSQKKIFCRNFFLFILLIKYSSNFFNNKSLKIFIKPKKIFFNNILKAPYKNKTSKNQIGFEQYNLNFSIKTKKNIILFENINLFFIYTLEYKKLFFFIETNFIKNDSFKFNIHYSIKNYFLI